MLVLIVFVFVCAVAHAIQHEKKIENFERKNETRAHSHAEIADTLHMEILLLLKKKTQ